MQFLQLTFSKRHTSVASTTLEPITIYKNLSNSGKKYLLAPGNIGRAGDAERFAAKRFNKLQATSDPVAIAEAGEL